MNDDALRMNRFTLRFANPDAEQKFALEQAQKSLRPIRVALITMAVLVTASTLLRILVFRDTFSALQRPWMLGIDLAVVAVCIAATRSRFFMHRNQWVLFGFACILSAGTIHFANNVSHEFLTTRGYLPLLIFLFVLYGLFRLRLPAATAAGVLSVCAYIGFFFGTGLLSGLDVARHAVALVFANALGMVICYQMELATRREFIAMRELGEERERSERLLLNVLPAAIADRLKTSSDLIADYSAEVTVLFADIVGFTPLSAKKSPQELVRLLDLIFSEFDALAEKHGLEKIKTIGDAYMAAAGLPDKRLDHAPAAAHMAQEMLASVARIALETGEALVLRIGLSSGPVVAGVIGRKKFIYDLWGDTVNTASRMESHGLPGMIHCSEATAALLRPAFALTARGAMKIDGKGEMSTYLVRS